MSAESPRHARSGGPLTVSSQPPSDRSLIDTVSGFINDVTLSSSSAPDPKDTIQWARFEIADINEPTPEGENDNEIAPLLLILGYGSGVQVWLIPPNGEAQEVLSWRQGTVRVLRILLTPLSGDSFAGKRPLIALCDSASPGPTFCSLSFISVRGGEQVKSIKFKNPILDVQANKRSVVVAFAERFAVFDAGTLEDRMAVTTCYPGPCPLGGTSPINPISLGDCWVAFADRKINPSKRSCGGCEGDGVSSYTATVLHAAKSLSKGLRGLGESVAHSLAGGRATSQSPSPPNADLQQPGVVTIIDIEGLNEDDCQDGEEPYDPIVAHFVAHSEAITALKFDASGKLLVTADRRGHDFHVFRINPHPCGPGLASVHHLYILHRGDTTAKVQDIMISPDARWAAVSTLRGTTHVFPVSPYGGACGVRTHTQPRLVNRLSRFHRSAGLPIHAASGSASPVGDGVVQGAWFPNPRLPPFPLPTTVTPLAQLRPTAAIPTHTITRTSSGRQRLSSLSEDASAAPLLARACFGTCPAPPPAGAAPRAPAALSLYLMAANGCLIHYVLHPRPASNVPKEKVCDETPVEVEVECVSQWALQRPPAAPDLLAPLPHSNPLLHHHQHRCSGEVGMSEEERWLSQVEIVSHAGPHRRLWMGPQFVFKTYTCTGSNTSLSEAETVDVDPTAATGAPRSNPMNMPATRPLVPVFIDSGSASSLEHSPSDSFRRRSLAQDCARAPVTDVQLKDALAEAMKEDHGVGEERAERPRAGGAPVQRAVDPLGTVVAPRAERPPPAEPDPDGHTLANCDEAGFRPVVRAPAPAPGPELLLRPLPRGTTIPVQRAPAAAAAAPYSPADEPAPLASHTVIPAELTAARPPEGGSFDFESLPSSSSAEPDDVQPGGASVSVQEPPTENPVERVDGFAISVSDKYDRVATADVELKDENATKSHSRRKEKDSFKEKRLDDRYDDSKRDAYSFSKEKSQKYKVDKVTYGSDEGKEVFKEKNERQITDSYSGKTNIEKCYNKEKETTIEKQQKSKNDEKRQTIEEGNMFREDKPKYKTEVLRTDIKYVDEKDVIKEKHIKVKTDNYKTFVSEEKNKLLNEKVQKRNPEKFGCDVDFNVDTDIVIKEKNQKPNFEKVDDVDVRNIRIFKEKSPKQRVVDITTENQAWDMLLNNTEKNVPTIDVSQHIEKIPDDKPKTKKSRKSKSKNYDESGDKDDSFVEIHNISENRPTTSSVLVSIPTDFEEPDLSSTYLPKLKQFRQSKSLTPERKNIGFHSEKTKFERASLDFLSDISFDRSKNTVIENISIGEELLAEPKAEYKSSVVKSLDVLTESNLLVSKESSNKSRKTKSVSPFFDHKKSIEKLPSESDDKNVIVIESIKDDFPEIQITRGSKTRKKLPQPYEVKSHETEVPERPVKSWSSIAAVKSGKKVSEERNVTSSDFEEVLLSAQTTSSKDTNLQKKLIQLCKRPDIMVAECDIPSTDLKTSELNFVEEHHSVLEDLPPLEPLNFALDDFKLEVMRDSLLDANDTKVTSPICKINIDDILSSINDTSVLTTDASMYNFVTLENNSFAKENSFSVIESDNVTRELEVKTGKKDQEFIEKLSDIDDENVSPIASQTDSERDEKKITGIVTVQPSSKQSKAKKSRKKKK